MGTMKSTTTIRTEYTPAGKLTGGTWRPIGTQLHRYHAPEIAENALAAYKRSAAEKPNLFLQYDEYKIMQRATITTVCEWEDVPGRPAKSE